MFICYDTRHNVPSYRVPMKCRVLRTLVLDPSHVGVPDSVDQVLFPVQSLTAVQMDRI